MQTQKSSVKRERHDEKTFFWSYSFKIYDLFKPKLGGRDKGVDLKCDVLLFKVCRFDRSCKS